MTANQDFVVSHYQQVLDRIAAAEARSGREPGSVRLVVVTKTHPVESIQAAIEAGARFLGENYADEAVPKIQALTGSGVEWHMIGHVQSRKSRMVSEHFDYLHALDSLKLARRLSRECQELGKMLPVLLECNVSGEETKFGYTAWEREQWISLKKEVEEISALPNLDVRGLMTMAPYFDQPEQARPIFARLRELRDWLQGQFSQINLGELSMGMSGDFEAAIEEGATWVRIGTAIMGQRQI